MLVVSQTYPLPDGKRMTVIILNEDLRLLPNTVGNLFAQAREDSMIMLMTGQVVDHGGSNNPTVYFIQKL